MRFYVSLKAPAAGIKGYVFYLKVAALEKSQNTA
jgi:hypothetical protein